MILALGATLLSTAMPIYASLARTPEEVFFGEGVFILSQGSSGHALTTELVEGLRSQPWALAVSPEVYAFIALDGRAVVVRGVELDAFLRLEALEPPAVSGEEFLLLGSRLAAQLNLKRGDLILLPGSTRPVLLEATIDAVLPPAGALDDEIVIDLPRARLLAGLGSRTIILIRVLAEDEQALLDYLAATDATVVVGSGSRNVRVEDGHVEDDRIGALLLTRPELARQLGRSYVGSFAQYSGNSLQVLVLGMMVLTASLFVLILSSSMVRFFVESRRSVGLMIALGGGLRSLLSSFGSRVLLLGAAGAVVGFPAGFFLGTLLEASGGFRFFGHVLRYELTQAQVETMLILYAAVLLASVFLSLVFLLKQQPRDLLYERPGRVLEVPGP